MSLRSLRRGVVTAQRRRGAVGGALTAVAAGAVRTVHHTRPLNYDPAATAYMTRCKHPLAAVGVAEVRFRYVNIAKFEDALSTPSSSILIKAAVESSTGTITPVTFDGGAATKSLAPGEAVWSDWVPVTTSGHVWSRSYVTGAAAGQIPVGRQMTAAEGDGVELNGTDKALSGTVAAGGDRGHPPVRIDTRGTTAATSYAIVGDSINQETTTYLARALEAAGVPHVSVATGGDSAFRFRKPEENARRLATIAGCATVISAEGANDLNARPESEWALVAADFAAVWEALAANGATRVYACTVTPRTADTAGTWTGTATQTPNGGNAARVKVNDWIRAGAPLVGSTPVVPGTIGASLHPNLRGHIDAADTMETARNSGLWRTQGGLALTGDGLHPNDLGDATIAAGIALPWLDTTAPTAPTGLAATAGNGKVTLTWADPTGGATSIGVYRGGTFIASVLPGVQTLDVTGLTNGAAQSFQLDAADAAGNRSARTAAVSSTPTAPASPPEYVGHQTASQSATGVTAVPVKLPAGVQAGDTLVAYFGGPHASTFDVIAAPAGWTRRLRQIGNTTTPTSAPNTYLYTKTADGTESGTTVNFTLNASTGTTGGWSSITYALRNVPEAPTGLTGALGNTLASEAAPTTSGHAANAIVLSFVTFDRQPTAVTAAVSGGGYAEDAEVFAAGVGTNPALVLSARVVDSDGGTSPQATWTAQAARAHNFITAAFG